MIVLKCMAHTLSAKKALHVLRYMQGGRYPVSGIAGRVLQLPYVKEAIPDYTWTPQTGLTDALGEDA